MKGGETWNCSMNDETRYFNLGKNILTSTNMNFRILIMTFLKHARMRYLYTLSYFRLTAI